MQKIIDSHVHVWDLNYMQPPWLDREKYLNQTFTEEDYLEYVQKQKYQIEKATYIEVDTRTNDLTKENLWINSKANEEKSILKAAVISGDLSSSKFSQYINRYLKESVVKGVR